MALSEELKEVYTSNRIDTRFYDTLELSHPEFSQVYYIVRDNESHSWEIESGTVTFTPYPFSLILPEAGSNQQDLSLTFDNVDRTFMAELERASSNIKIPITATYRVYIDHSTANQINPVTLLITSVIADPFTVQATASRPSLYEKKLPTGREAFYDKRFRGLWL